MRTHLMAGNWKMNLDIKESSRLANDLKEKNKDVNDREILICPSFTSLDSVSKIIAGSNIKLGAQNVCFEDKGAFTGEISPSMLKENGCEYVIVGHSERRHVFNEDNDMANRRLKNAIKNKLKVILCVGETLEEREEEMTNAVVSSQVKESLDGVSKEDMGNIVIAYEPVWAIGTGKNASPAQAEAIHLDIRKQLEVLYDKKISDSTRILYGGSVKPENIKELMSQEDIDGVLVGGASLKADDFSKIVNY